MSKISAETSDTIARGCTGAGSSKRQLYSDDDDVIYKFKHCIGLNGINQVIEKSDLMDRTILLHLERISESDRIDEEEFWESFNTSKPAILGGIFDVLSKAMALRPNVKLEKLPRMADFAKWGYAITQALDKDGEDFIKAYEGNVERQNESVLEYNTLMQAVLKFMEDKDEWEDTVNNTYEELKKLVDVSKTDKTFPGGSNWLTRRLNEIKPNLLDYNITFEKSDGTDKGTYIKIKNESSVSSESPFFNMLEAVYITEVKDEKLIDFKALKNRMKLNSDGNNDKEELNDTLKNTPFIPHGLA